MPGLMTLVQSSSGYVLHHMPSWAEDPLALERNVRFVWAWKETYVSRMIIGMRGRGRDGKAGIYPIGSHIRPALYKTQLDKYRLGVSIREWIMT